MAPLDPGRERAIIDATLELLAEVGYDRMSIDRIAGRAKASKATIYRRWAGKAELVADVIRHRLDSEAPAAEDTGSLRGDLVAVFRGFCELAERRHPLVLGLAPALISDAELARTVREHLPAGDPAVVEAPLERARKRGELTGPVEAGRVRRVIEALIWHRLLFVGPPFDDRFAEESVDGVLVPLVRAWAANSDTSV